ncbi:MAG: DMT family transporter [Pseudomonadota bacterium]
MLVLLSVLWGSSFVFVELILTAIPVFTLVALRVSIAAIALWISVLATGAKLPTALPVWAAFGVLGLLNNVVPFSLIVWGQTAITAGLAAILNATTPIFTAVIATLVLADEKLTAAKMAGLILGLCGVAVMIGPDAVATLGEDLFHQLAVLGAALSYGFAAVFVRRFKGFGAPPMVIAAGQTSAAGLIMVPVALLVDGPSVLGAPGLGVWSAILANAVLSTAFAYCLYFILLRRAGATNTVLVTVLVPVVAVVVGTITLNEALSATQIVGMMLIFCALAVIDGRLLRRSR